MARLQILELPEGAGDDRPPFVLVIDQARAEDFYPSAEGKSTWQIFQERTVTEDPTRRIAAQVGARAVLVFEDTIDIPANEISLSEAADGNVVRIRVEPDLEGFTETVMAEVAKAQAEAIDAARQQMIDELGEKRAAPTGEEIPAVEALSYRTMGLAYSLEEAQAAIDRVRNLHRPVEHNGQTICWECSAYDFPSQSTDNSPVGYDQCGTLRALNGADEVVVQTRNGPRPGKVVGPTVAQPSGLWSDHDMATAAVSDALRLTRERTDIARDMDRLAKWKNEITDALGMDRTRDWDDIRNAARGIRKQRDSMRDAIQRVRDLPEQPDAMDTQHPNPPGYLHGYSVAVRAAKQATKEPERTRLSDG